MHVKAEFRLLGYSVGEKYATCNVFQLPFNIYQRGQLATRFTYIHHY